MALMANNRKKLWNSVDIQRIEAIPSISNSNWRLVQHRLDILHYVDALVPKHAKGASSHSKPWKQACAFRGNCLWAGSGVKA
jgi:hypothetical protein